MRTSQGILISPGNNNGEPPPTYRVDRQVRMRRQDSRIPAGTEKASCRFENVAPFSCLARIGYSAPEILKKAKNND